MSTFSQRLTQASVLEAATPAQLDHAASVMVNVFGPWDKQKSLGGSSGVLTWLAKNPGIKAFPGIQLVLLEYEQNVLGLEIRFRDSSFILAEGKSWAHIRKALREQAKGTGPEGKKVIKALLSTRADAPTK